MTTRILLRGGCVLTLGAKTPNFTQADLLIEDGRVAEVGPGLRARDAEPVDASDTIVMPGFVDSHRHAWTSLFRNLGESDSIEAGPRLAAALGDRYEAEDVYAATLVSLLGAVEAGITTVVDWSDLRPDGGSAEAALQAHADAGLRTVFVAGHVPLDDHDVGASTRRLIGRLIEAAGPSTEIAFGSAFPRSADLGEVAETWSLARELGLRIHAHAGAGVSGRGAIAQAGERGALGGDVTFVHHADLDEGDLAALAASGAAVSVAPASQMASGLGSPPIQQLVDHDIRPGLAVDDERVAPGDMFAQMRALISLQHATVFDRKLAGKASLPRLMSTRDVIRYATRDGARVAGQAGLTGSLEPGMQADIVILRTDRPNIYPINDPIGAVVWGMDTSNVDWVFAGGHVLMRGGVLEADVQRARALATVAQQRVVDPSRLAVGAAPGGDG